MNKIFIGKWKITEMELWDSDYIDLVEPGFISFDDAGHGEFMFGVVSGFMSCGHGQNIVDFLFHEPYEAAAEVRGTHPYRVDFSVSDEGEIEADCTCPAMNSWVKNKAFICYNIFYFFDICGTI